MQLRLLLPPGRGWEHPSSWKELIPSGTFPRCREDNKLACLSQPSVWECLCTTLLGNVGRERVATCSDAEAAHWHLEVRKQCQSRMPRHQEHRPVYKHQGQHQGSRATSQAGRAGVSHARATSPALTRAHFAFLCVACLQSQADRAKLRLGCSWSVGKRTS